MHAGDMPCHFWACPDDGFHQPEPWCRRAGYTHEGWYFWDETEAYVLGPYSSFEQGEVARREYKP